MLPRNVEVLQEQLKAVKTENETLRTKLEEVSEDRAGWRHKYMLLSAQRNGNKT